MSGSGIDATAAGFSALRDAYVVSPCNTAGNNQCVNFMAFRGPYSGSDPSTKFTVADVRRTSDAQFGDKAFYNVLKMQAAQEALLHAGVATPYAALQKNHMNVQPVVQVGTGGGSLAAAGYDVAPHSMFVPFGGGVSHAPALVPPSLDYGNLATFSNGVSLVGNPAFGSPGLPADLGTCSAGKQRRASSTTGNGPASSLYHPSYSDISSFAGQFNSMLPTIPGVSLFSVPEFPGAITTLEPSGAEAISALGQGDVLKAVIETGNAQEVQGLFPTPGSADASKSIFNAPVIIPKQYGPTPNWTKSTPAMATLAQTGSLQPEPGQTVAPLTPSDPHPFAAQLYNPYGGAPCRSW